MAPLFNCSIHDTVNGKSENNDNNVINNKDGTTDMCA